jgi:hypothetical protein
MRTFFGTLFLRIVVCFSLVFPAIISFIDPDKAVAVLPALLTHFIAAKTLLIVFAGYELLFAVLIFIKPDPSWPAGVVFIISIVLVFLNLSDLAQVYQNIIVAFSALSLSFFGKIRG